MFSTAVDRSSCGCAHMADVILSSCCSGTVLWGRRRKKEGCVKDGFHHPLNSYSSDSSTLITALAIYLVPATALLSIKSLCVCVSGPLQWHFGAILKYLKIVLSLETMQCCSLAPVFHLFFLVVSACHAMLPHSWMRG